jgi:hypothetical protein
MDPILFEYLQILIDENNINIIPWQLFKNINKANASLWIYLLKESYHLEG